MKTMLKQEYDNYTTEDHKVWSILFERQLQTLSTESADEYLQGLKDVKFEQHRIPHFDEVNQYLLDHTGWHIHPVPGIMPNKEFFELLAQKKFPATTWIRKMEQLDYLEEPDMFHDVFGHVPLLSNPDFCNYLLGLSSVALQHINNPEVIDRISRAYWFTVEFGLINQGDKLKIYGAGLASSIGETKHALHDNTGKIPFNITTITNTPYRNDVYQDSYFVIESFDDLYASLDELKKNFESA